MKDAGRIHVCELREVSEAGLMPVEKLVVVTCADFEERTFGLQRQYAAKGVNERIDLLARIWRDTSVRIGMYAVITDSDYDGQYRIDDVRNQLDDDGLKVTDITLQRLDKNYDVDAKETNRVRPRPC